MSALAQPTLTPGINTMPAGNVGVLLPNADEQSFVAGTIFHIELQDANNANCNTPEETVSFAQPPLATAYTLPLKEIFAVPVGTLPTVIAGSGNTPSTVTAGSGNTSSTVTAGSGGTAPTVVVSADPSSRCPNVASGYDLSLQVPARALLISSLLYAVGTATAAGPLSVVVTELSCGTPPCAIPQCAGPNGCANAVAVATRNTTGQTEPPPPSTARPTEPPTTGTTTTTIPTTVPPPPPGRVGGSGR